MNIWLSTFLQISFSWTVNIELRAMEDILASLIVYPVWMYSGYYSLIIIMPPQALNSMKAPQNPSKIIYIYVFMYYI